MWRVDPSQIFIAIRAGRPARRSARLAAHRAMGRLAFGQLTKNCLPRVCAAACSSASSFGFSWRAQCSRFTRRRYRVCSALNPLGAQILETLVIYQAIAAMDLSRHVKAIIVPLANGNLAAARSRLAWIVGRDTEALSESEISRAAIESVAESTTDAVIGPLFWTFVAGAPGALLYRTANTLDSMVGHRTDAYEKFGKASARIDDVLNWLPARICAGAFCVFRSAVRWKTIRREAAAHASPNAGWGEAAMAYAIGVRLGGDNFYDGQCVHGPVFNASGRASRCCGYRARAWSGCGGLPVCAQPFLSRFRLR